MYEMCGDIRGSIQLAGTREKPSRAEVLRMSAMSLSGIDWVEIVESYGGNRVIADECDAIARSAFVDSQRDEDLRMHRAELRRAIPSSRAIAASLQSQARSLLRGEFRSPGSRGHT